MGLKSHPHHRGDWEQVHFHGDSCAPATLPLTAEALAAALERLVEWTTAYSDHSGYCDTEKEPLWACSCGFDSMIEQARAILAALKEQPE